MSTVKFLDAKAIDLSIKSIQSRGQKLDKDIQITAASCLNHIELHGDVTLFNRLFLAMPKGSRKTALTQWGIAFGKLSANAGDNKKEAPFLYDKSKDTNLAEALANPWYDFAPEKAPDEVFDVIKALHGLLTKAGKANSVKGADLLEKLRRLEASDADEVVVAKEPFEPAH